MKPSNPIQVGDRIEVTWNPQKRGGVTVTGVVEHIHTGWNSIYGQETTQVTFRDSDTGQQETAVLHLDRVVRLPK
jgi:hypothetical protein